MNEASGKDRLVSPVCVCVLKPTLVSLKPLVLLSNDGGLQFRTGLQGASMSPKDKSATSSARGG